MTDEAKRLLRLITKAEAARRAGSVNNRINPSVLRDALRRAVTEMESPPALDALSDERLEQRLADRAANWRDVLTGEPILARQALRALLAGPIVFAPEAGG